MYHMYCMCHYEKRIGSLLKFTDAQGLWKAEAHSQLASSVLGQSLELPIGE